MTIGAWQDWLEQSNGYNRQESRREANPVAREHRLMVTQDSRQLQASPVPPTLFVALPGEWHDGHKFLASAHEAGVRYFLVETGRSLPELPESDIISCQDVLIAWQELAHHWRMSCGADVFGITGSNGKTTVKEWLIQLFSKDHVTYGSPRSFNSQIGVTLSLGDLQTAHEVAFIEAGISKPGEMVHHQKNIAPAYGVLTHIGNAHLEHFSSLHELVEEKIMLFQSCVWVAMPGELTEAAERLKNRSIQVYTWGPDPEDDMRVSSQVVGNARVVQATWAENEYQWQLPFGGEIGYRNAMTAALTALAWGVDPEWLGAALSQFQDLDHRMQRLRKTDGSWVISDAYTNDWDALQLAVKDLNQLAGSAGKAALIGEIPGFQSGDENRLLELIKDHGIQTVWVVGHPWSALKGHPETRHWRFFDSAEDALNHWEESAPDFDQKNTLIKGARIQRFERFVSLLTYPGHVTRLELDLEVLATNLRVIRSFIRNRCGTDVDILSVIKASGYGTSGPAIAKLLQFQGVELLAVACTEEGVELRRNGVTTRIMVLNPEPTTFPALLNHRLEPAIHGVGQYEAFSAALHANRRWPIHIKLDTGMHRLGFLPQEMHEVQRIMQNPLVEVKTVFSHLASADIPEQDAFTLRQIQQFEECVQPLKQSHPGLQTHLLNTAGMIRFPRHAGHYVRVGIGLFGIRTSFADETLELLPAVRFSTVISALHRIPPHEGVGYGNEDSAEYERVVATLPLGYADGFPRNLSNGKGSVIVQGVPAPVVGKVCMDMTMVDVTHIVPCNVGDEVEIFGRIQTIESFAQQAGTIPYEILTRIPGRVQRIQHQG